MIAGRAVAGWPAVVIGAGLALALSACAPQPVVAPPDPPPGPGATPASAQIRAYYTRVENNLRAQGLMRTDTGVTDAPFSARQLTEDFVKIALYDEYVSTGAGLYPRETRSRLRRWEQPVRFSVEFGRAVPAAQRQRDQSAIGAYVHRLARVSRHPMRIVGSGANFHVLIVTEDERRALGPRLNELVPGIGAAAVRTIETMPTSTFCLVYAFSEGGASDYSNAVAVIRSEHPDALRLSCIHEELAQGLGLAKDSPAARPSIFNDDEEFALLTRHDELLLRILYDDRLHPGMTEAEARPIVEQIAAELLGEAS